MDVSTALDTISIEARHELFVPLSKPVGICDHMGPSPAYDPQTQELLGYRVGLYKGQLLRKLHLAQDESKTEIFPLENWEQKRDEALTYLQR